MTPQPDPDEGLLFDVPRAAASAASAPAPEKRRPADELPVARVVVDTPLPHLDRPFDYHVPADMADDAVPGCRVRVPFHGQLLSGYLLERAATSDFTGRLAYLHQVVSPEPVVTAEIRGLARAVADRYAGTLSDVLRLAVPPRHARVEKEAETKRRKAAEAAEAAARDAAADGAGTPTALGAEAVPERVPDPAEDDAAACAGPAGEVSASDGAPPPPAGSGDAPQVDSTPGAAPTPGVDIDREGAGVGKADADGDGAVPIPAPEADTDGADADTDTGPVWVNSDADGAAPGAGADADRAGAGTAGGASGRGPAAFSSAASVGAPGRTSPAGTAGTGGEGHAAVAEGADAAVPPEAGAADATPASAATERTSPAGGVSAPPAPGPWADYPAGPSFLEALHRGQAPRAVWGALPGPDWAEAIAVAVATALAGGRGAVVVVPDGRDVGRVDAALAERLGEGRHVALTAELGPAERYRRWLAALRGEVGAVVGTRAAMFAPVRDLGLVVLWDDGDDVHVDPHAPYPHARTVLSMRAHRMGAAALFGGFTRTTEATQLVASGWAHPLAADRAMLRRRAPRVRSTDDDSQLERDEAARTARIPRLALRVAREAAREGPVLIQVPRRGYVAALGCVACRAPARCDACQGPLALRSAHAMPFCRWCGHLAGAWTCGACGGGRLRANVVGARRTAEEMGRAFPSLTVRTSGRDEDVLDRVPDRPALVVATPGAEPVADGGYAAAVLLDGWALLGRADLRAGEETLRRWCNAAALVRSAEDGGQVVVVAEAQLPATQALIRWDPAGFAERELEERRQLGFPPAVAMASVTGEPALVRELIDGVELPASADLLGPVPVGAGQAGDGPATERALLRTPRADVHELTSALKAAAAARSVRNARKDEPIARIRVDPLDVV
jgi:primosomal protein N' (replication factor Y)